MTMLAKPTRISAALHAHAVAIFQVLSSLLLFLSMGDPVVDALMCLSPQHKRQSRRSWSSACTTPPQMTIVATQPTFRRIPNVKIDAATADVRKPDSRNTTTITCKNDVGAEKDFNCDCDGDWEAVSRCVRNIVRSAACQSFQERGQFCLAIGGGGGGDASTDTTTRGNNNNILVLSDMLMGTANRDGSYWTSKTTLIYAHHPCYSSAAVAANNSNNNGDDASVERLCYDQVDNSKSIIRNQQTMNQLLLDEWKGTKVIAPHSTPGDAVVQAANYVRKLRSLPLKCLPRMCNSGRAETDIPVLDLIVLMMTDDDDDDDGIRLYLTTTEDEAISTKKKKKKKKKRKHVPWVVPVGNDSNKKGDPSFSTLALSLPVLNAAKRVVVVVVVTEIAAGTNEMGTKPSNWKSSLQRAIPNATWMMVRDTAKTTSILGQPPHASTSATTNIGRGLFPSPTNRYLDSLTVL